MKKLFALLLLLATSACAQSLPPDTCDSVDRIAKQVLATTTVPSASIAIVKDGKIAYVQAYGDARLDPRTPATPPMRYSIGSISKQFTATAILMLAEQGKLSLDDTVSKFIPNLTRANEVTIRQLLSHTSGYQDYWPQDYVPPFMLTQVTADTILDRWARKPLDFDPGTKWQYSNTNFVIAGVIIEKASGTPLLKFLSDKIFSPLGMNTVVNIDQDRLTQTDPVGYMRYALGPPRVAPKEGKGWLFAAGELAMPAQELAKWDIAMLDQKLLKPASYKEMQTEVKLKNGEGTGYGLGISVGTQSGHRALSHGGEVSGFVSQNVVFPDDHAAVAVLTNQDASTAAGQIARRISQLLFANAQTASTDPNETVQDRKIFEDLQRGVIDRALFTSNANDYFNDQAIKDYASSLGPLGKPDEFTQTGKEGRGGMIFRRYTVKFPQKTVNVTIYAMPDNKIEQYLVSATN
ncbi:MAG: beta-lactamase [Acidobacteriales bacterium]|nr:beta-lactamase [Terriglobales bacterium]